MGACLLRRVGLWLLVAALVWLPFGRQADALAESPFMTFSGTWSGNARVVFSGGSSETLKCRAYYAPRDQGAALGLAIRFASTSAKIELRSNLAHKNGAVSGKWEERSYNAAGDVQGHAATGRLMLHIAGGGLKGTMLVTTSGTSQSVTIRTDGVGFSNITIDLSRS